MSFSKKVKEELCKHISPSRHCALAELSALIEYGGDMGNLLISTDNEAVARKCFTLFEKTFKMNEYGLSERNDQGKRFFSLKLSEEDERKVGNVLSGDLLLQKNCCKRAYLRGAFIAAGSVSDPEKSYHLEIVCRDGKKADRITELFQCFDINAKTVIRKGSYVAYIKEGGKVVDALNVMEAHVALMDYENVRILKDVYNSVNRKVNCDTANINKTVEAAIKQKEAIEYAMTLPEYKELPKEVREIAELRLKYPDVSLKELGEMSDPKVGKSGVNHRLRKILKIAENRQFK
ncbi:MAG: DNA-binding protein WhiA [Lachnospiraceae bacterium]|nr:DNA-binding protein WhiA [Lachnospiraceae bacterium]